MKKRMIAIVLSISVLCGSLFCVKRASAVAGTVGSIVTIGVLAWEILDIMIKGEEPAIIEAIRVCIEEDIDAFTNPNSGFRQIWGDFWDNWGVGWQSMCDTLTDWFDSGACQVSDGVIKLRNEQYLQLYRQLVKVVSTPSVDFHADYPAFFFDFEGDPYAFPFGGLPTFDGIVQSGQSYALCYSNPAEGKLVFSDYYIVLVVNGYGEVRAGAVTEKFGVEKTYTYFESWGAFLSNPNKNFTFSSFDSVTINLESSPRVIESTNCFVFSDGVLTYTPISEVDLTGYNKGVVSTVANYNDFLKSLYGFSSSVSSVGDDLSDLSDVLPDGASLTFPANPDLDKDLADQIIVGDVVGAEDLPLSDYLNNALDFDISVPSVILTKFPFCIPYDLVRFFGVLAADPVPPVFHIPISTHPKNLEQWSDNETIGQYVSPNEPMFNIDEEIVLDFAHIPLVQPICYTVFIVGFVILLIHITSKMIQH